MLLGLTLKHESALTRSFVAKEDNALTLSSFFSLNCPIHPTVVVSRKRCHNPFQRPPNIHKMVRVKMGLGQHLTKGLRFLVILPQTQVPSQVWMHIDNP